MDAAGNVDPTPATFEADVADQPPSPYYGIAPPWPGQSATPPPMQLRLATGTASTRTLARRRAIPVDVSTPTAGRLRVRLTGSRRRKLGARAVRLAVGERRIAVRLGATMRSFLRSHRRLRVTAVGSLAPVHGGKRLRATSKALIG